MAVLARRPLRRRTYLNLIAVPPLLLVSLIWAYPFLWTLSTAFKTQLGAFTAGANLIPQPVDNLPPLAVVRGIGGCWR